MSAAKHTPLERELIAALERIKRTTMHARRFGIEDMRSYRSACVSAEGDAEDALNLAHAPHSDNKVAAEPDLLEVLRTSPHRLHTPPPGEGPCRCSQCLFVTLRDAAIAKANGSTS